MSQVIEAAAVTPVARLLVVEDDAAVRAFCARLLRINGYTVDVAEHGQQALGLLQQQPYDLVLTDLHMPKLDGIELLQQIQLLHPDTDTIMITAFGTIDTAKRALKLGAFDFLLKPINAEGIERTVRQCLEYRRLRHERAHLSSMVTLLQLSRTINDTLDTETQVREIGYLLDRRFAPDARSLSLLDPEHDELMLLAADGLPYVVWPQRQRLNGARDDETLRGCHYELLGGRPQAAEQLEACVVLRTSDRPVGVLHLSRADGRPPFDTNDRQLLTVFAAQVASALENARLYAVLKDQNTQIITALAAAIDARDPYTRGHSEQVAHYAVQLAVCLKLPPPQVEQIRYAALLHDIGKIGISDAILRKQGPLDDAEYTAMKQHPVIGAEIVRGIGSLHHLIPSIAQHHERIDGRGYPYGLADDEIQLAAKILAIADSFDAMTSQRAYRDGMSVERAINELLRGRGRQWDAHLIDVFIELLRQEQNIALPADAQPAARALLSQA